MNELLLTPVKRLATQGSSIQDSMSPIQRVFAPSLGLIAIRVSQISLIIRDFLNICQSNLCACINKKLKNLIKNSFCSNLLLFLIYDELLKILEKDLFKFLVDVLLIYYILQDSFSSLEQLLQCLLILGQLISELLTLLFRIESLVFQDHINRCLFLSLLIHFLV